MKKLLSVLLITATICAAASCSNKISNDPENSELLTSETTNNDEVSETVDTGEMKGEFDPATNMYYTLIDGGKSYSVYPGEFPDVIKELVIPGEYKGLPVTEFSGYLYEHSIETIIISEGIKKITGSFDDCFDIKNIYIPASVIYIGGYTFNSYPTMGGIPHFKKSNVIEKIVVAEGNPCYYVDRNCLIEKSSKKIILGCNSSVIPNDGSVKIIACSAFANCKSIETIILPKSIIEIESYAFVNCRNLKQVYIISSIKDEKIVNFDEESAFGNGPDCIFYVPDAESLEFYSKFIRPHINIEIGTPEQNPPIGFEPPHNVELSLILVYNHKHTNKMEVVNEKKNFYSTVICCCGG